MRKLFFIVFFVLIIYPVIPSVLRPAKIDYYYLLISKKAKIFNSNMFSSLVHITHVPTDIKIFKNSIQGEVIKIKSSRFVYIEAGNKFISLFSILGYENNLSRFNSFENIFKGSFVFDPVTLSTLFGDRQYFYDGLNLNYYKMMANEFCYADTGVVKLFIEISYLDVFKSEVMKIEGPFIYWDCSADDVLAGEWND